MNREILLERAVQKAIDGGWTNSAYDWLDTVMSDSFDVNDAPLFIFNHDFAKALWGERLQRIDGSQLGSYKDWKYHLQQTVIADDPITYLGEHLD